MIFDRIMILKHVGSIPLTDSLSAELDRIRNAYPAWDLDPHESSRFVAWKEVRWGSDTQYSVGDLNSLKDSDLIDILMNEQDLRVGLLESWNEFCSVNSTRAMNILGKMAKRFPNKYPDVWNYGLRGISEVAHDNNTQRILDLLLGIPNELFDDSEILRSTARVIRLYSDAVRKQENTIKYWKLFDRTLKHAIKDKSNLAQKQDNDWIHRSINSSIGDLFLGFFPLLFSRKLNEGSLIPSDLVDRFESLIQPDSIHHRPARVLAASKLSYLHAVDPEWTKKMLFPSLNWSDEEESIALWQGFGKTARIDSKLWEEIQNDFLELFTYERLKLLGDISENFCCLLMKIGIEASFDEQSSDRICSAVNTIFEFDNEMILEAADWIANYIWIISRNKSGSIMENNSDKSHVDYIWRERVLPWLKKIWPPESVIRGNGVSKHFAIAAILADESFKDVFEFVRRYLCPGNMFTILNDLAESEHPEKHASETFSLLQLIYDESEARQNKINFEKILNRVIKKKPKFQDDAAIRKWREALRDV